MMLILLVCGPHWEQPRSGLGIWTVSDFVAQMAVFKTLGSQLNIDGLT